MTALTSHSNSTGSATRALSRLLFAREARTGRLDPDEFASGRCVIPDEDQARAALRLDLSDRDLRLAKELGCKIVIDTDAHDARVLGRMEYGIRQLKRAWLQPKDVLNTLPASQVLAALRPRS